MSLRNKVITHILDVEGGHVNDPEDSGGETNWGITIAVARKHGYTGRMIDLPRDMAYQIYSEIYWDSMHLTAIESFSFLVAGEMADTGVNQGVGRASTFLQIALNAFNNREQDYPDIAEDGNIGSGTLSALKALFDKRGNDGMLVLTKALNCQQGAFYLDLTRRRQKDEKYVYGWFNNRV